MALRSTVMTALNNGVALTKWSWLEFSKLAKSEGFNQYGERLNPKEGKYPCLFWLNTTTNALLTVMLGIEVAKLLASGAMPAEALKGLTVIDGLNSNKEQRYYLSRNGFAPITVDEAIAVGEAYISKAKAMSEARLKALMA